MKAKGTRHYVSKPNQRFVKDGKNYYENTAYEGPKKGKGKGAAQTGLTEPKSVKAPKVDPVVAGAIDELRDKYNLKGSAKKLIREAMEGPTGIPSESTIRGKALRRDPERLKAHFSGPMNRTKTAVSALPDEYGAVVQREMKEHERQASTVYGTLLAQSNDPDAGPNFRTDFRVRALQDSIRALGPDFPASAANQKPKWKKEDDGTMTAQTMHVGMDGQILLAKMKLDEEGRFIVGSQDTYLSESKDGWDEVFTGEISNRTPEGFRPYNHMEDAEGYINMRIREDNAVIIAAEQYRMISREGIGTNENEATRFYGNEVASAEENLRGLDRLDEEENYRSHLRRSLGKHHIRGQRRLEELK